MFKPIKCTQTIIACSFIEINECHAENGGCEQECTNTNGSFQCSCYSGYFGSVFCSGILLYKILT